MKHVPDLVDMISKKTGFTKKDIKELLDQLQDCIIELLCNNEDVKMNNLGTFKIRHKKARIGEQPLTKEKVFVPERKTVIFSVSKTLKIKVK